MTDTGDLFEGPLHSRHVEAGATFAPFGGWSMPVQYTGTVAEHTATRTTVGLFDVSHLGKALVTGPGAAEFVNTCVTNDLDRISAGSAQYTLCCDESGGVVDDLIAYRVSDQEVFLIPNAANTAEVVRRMQAAAAERAPEVDVTDEHRSRAVIAVQGPLAGEVLTAVGLPVDLDYMAFVDADWDGQPVRVCRTGYTGEYGFEVLPVWDQAGPVWDALAEQVLAREGALCGLGARDSLRTEAGYPLHGHELSLDLSPLEARCAWAIGWDKPSFWGRDELMRQKEAGPARRMYALEVTGRGVLRAGQTVRAGGRDVGVTSSGTFSPTLKTGIGLAFVELDAGLKKGDEVVVDVRGREVPCRLAVPPLVEIRTR
ncbi:MULTISPECIES: glycine cleavage system aminomethyltransferase GcvT [unclassified Dietzia]|uniref:glycine cleavage system aminomethyltransferase GcvT n=1 Tax=unclassified Dietzia TaxID=2617939 RepID=UPI0015FB04A7|nr:MULTISPECIES: glycine cleavage system aminomethyltransferase GcvT [unclassified Dietzia]MBB1026006.1 glycine cleavage system aminomethyltransferase GcvT [Dietzia sp. DQ12-76]MBB1027049.1 glycine cleavage system aminomethyltransferase GcvT [Dietzia sp. DQ11-38-2]